MFDLNMPGMDGDELGVRLPVQCVDFTPILVAVTAHDNDESCRRIACAGFDRMFVTPTELSDLVSALRKRK